MELGTRNALDTRKGGFVHTAELKVNWREGIDIEQISGDGKRITRCTRGKNERGSYARMRLNPNNERTYSPYSGSSVPRGNCKSLSDFLNIELAWARSKGYEMEDILTERVDFAVDSYAREREAEEFRKLCDLLVMTFIVKHEVSGKNQYCCETVIDKLPKSVKARYGCFEMERYNKAIQQPTRGAVWRMEMRYIRNKKRRDIPPESVAGMLHAVIAELLSLPAYYSVTLERTNRALLEEYAALKEGSMDKMRVNQFLYQNNDRIFSRSQVSAFFRGLDEGRHEKCRTFADNFSRRYEHLYISGALFERFIKELCEEVKKWVTNDPVWVDLKAE